MADLANARIDQHPLGVPNENDFGIYRDMTSGVTKRFSMAPFLTSVVTNNIEWVTDNDPGYALNDIVTYGGNIYQSLINDNLNIVPGSDVTKWQLLTRGVVWSRWAAGAFIEDDVFVIRAIDGEDHIVQLVDVARPYNSTDFDAEYAAGDWISLTQNKIVKAATVGANTAALNMNYLKERVFNFAAVIAEAKTWSLVNAGNLIKLKAIFEISGGLWAQTFPATFKLFTYAGLWNDGTKVWTPTDQGIYELEVTLLGGVHHAKLFGPF